jgi:NADP-dependent 3-hydroxy acid dehydrogenase YdfG
MKTRTSADPILITGCSTGIGRAVAEALIARGHIVYATARKPETLDDLKAKGAHVLALDVTNERSMAAAVRTIEAEHGAVGTLINNAGYAKYGALENIPIDDARAQLETNVFGLARMCQLVLPGMRKVGHGRILNVSSMGGRLTMPLGAWYHASKWSVEALSDTLRQEVRGFGVDVVIMEPGAVRTAFDATLDAGYVTGADGAYTDLETGARAMYANAYEGRLAITPAVAAKSFVRATEAKHPGQRYMSTAMARFSVQFRRLAGSRAWDAIVRSQFASAARSSPTRGRGGARRRSQSGAQSRE